MRTPFTAPPLPNEWLNDWLNDWLTDWMNEWMNEWMKERVVIVSTFHSNHMVSRHGQTIINHWIFNKPPMKNSTSGMEISIHQPVDIQKRVGSKSRLHWRYNNMETRSMNQVMNLNSNERMHRTWHELTRWSERAVNGNWPNPMSVCLHDGGDDDGVQVCNAVYSRFNLTQPLCACADRFRGPCSASIGKNDLHTIEVGLHKKVVSLMIPPNSQV